MNTLPQQLRHLLARYDAAIRELNNSGNGLRVDGPEFERLVREKIDLLSRK